MYSEIFYLSEHTSEILFVPFQESGTLGIIRLQTPSFYCDLQILVPGWFAFLSVQFRLHGSSRAHVLASTELLWQDPNVMWFLLLFFPALVVLLDKITGPTNWCHWKLKVKNFKPPQHAAFPSEHWLPCGGPWIPTSHTFLKLFPALPSVTIPASLSWRK